MQISQSEIVLYIFLIISIVFQIFLLLKLKSNNSESNIDFLRESKAFGESVLDLKHGLKTDLAGNFVHFGEGLSRQIISLQKEVAEQIRWNQDKTLGQVSELKEKMAQISSAQQNLSLLHANVDELRKILSDKKLRGIFGEFQLASVLDNVLGAPGGLYHLQYKLNNATICDSAIILGDEILCVDSKFPLENFKLYIESNDSSEQEKAARAFVKDFKKHVNDISQKYILPPQTLDQAIIFLPSESVYSILYAQFPELIQWTLEQRVWPSSPTTLMAILSTIQNFHRRIDRAQRINEIVDELSLLNRSYVDQLNKLDKFYQKYASLDKDFNDLLRSQRLLVDRFSQVLISKE